MRWPIFGPKQPSGPIRIPLPGTVEVNFLVFFRVYAATVPNPEQLRLIVLEWLKKHSADPLGKVLLEMVSRGLLGLEVGARGQMPEPPPQLVASWGSGESEIRRQAEATHTIWIRTEDALSPPRMGHWLAVGAARALAASLDGVVLDPVFPRLLALDLNREPLPPNGEIRVEQQVMVPQSVGNKGLMWTTSKGLSRFGLPELEIRDTPPNLGPAVGYLVNGAAQHLVRQLLNEASRAESPLSQLTLSPNLRITLNDIASARANGNHQTQEGARGWIEMSLEYRPGKPNYDSFLRLKPLEGAREKPGVWWSTELTELFGAGESTLRQVKADSEAMEAAHLQAMGELPRAKARFTAGLRPGEMLIVKHGFPTGNGEHEYMWLAVTAWRGDRLTCALMNLPEVCRDLRRGQSIELREADLFDWSLHLPNGETEGGYTNLVVMREHHEE